MSTIIYALAKYSLAHFCASAAEKYLGRMAAIFENYPANDAMLRVELSVISLSLFS